MPSRLIVFVSICFISFMLLPAHGADYVDRVVAVVNDDVITLSEVEKAGSNFFARIRTQSSGNELEMALEKGRKEVLNSLIDKMIVNQKAEELSITVEESEIDSSIAQILARNNATLQDFRNEMAKMNISEQEYIEVMDDIMAALDKNGIEEEAKKDVIAILYSLKDDIIRV